MAYLSSENIKVFPSIGRDSTTDLNAELTNEKNLTQILRSIYKRDSFVISDNYSDNSLEFVIHGYYFNATFDADSLSAEFTSGDKNNIYANIFVLKEPGNETSFQQLVNTNTPSEETLNLDIKEGDLDTNGEFTGVLFSNSASVNTTYSVYSLLILTKNDGGGGWVVPAKSKLHWKTSEVLDSDSSISIDNTLTTATLNATTISTVSATIETLSSISGTINTLTTDTLDATTISTETANITDLNSTSGDINTLTTSTLNATLSLNLSGDVSGNGSTSVVTNGITISNMTIGDGKVVESKISTGAVTAGKIAENAVTEVKIAANAVTTSKIKNESITLEKLVKDDIIRVVDNTLEIFPED